MKKWLFIGLVALVAGLLMWSALAYGGKEGPANKTCLETTIFLVEHRGDEDLPDPAVMDVVHKGKSRGLIVVGSRMKQPTEMFVVLCWRED